MKRRFYFKRPRRALPLLLCLLLLSGLAGAGYSAATARQYRPTLSGNVYSMLWSGGKLFMVLSEGGNNSLVKLDRAGNVESYCVTRRNEAFRYLEAEGDTVYAIFNTYKAGKTRQTLVSLSAARRSMRPKTLLRLDGAGGAPDGVEWRELYLPEADAPTLLRAAGVRADDGSAWLLRYDLATGEAACERVPAEGALLHIKYVREGYYVWIDRRGRVGQSVDGTVRPDLLAGRAATPLHLSTCGTRCFVSDSATGDIFRIEPDGGAALYRVGNRYLGSSEYRYRQLQTFTTREDEKGAVRVLGLCAGEAGAVVADEDFVLRSLSYGALGALLLWEHAWRVSLLVFAALCCLAALLHGVARARRILVRLVLCETALVALLLGAMAGLQYRSFQSTLRRDADEKLRLVGENLASGLAGEAHGDIAAAVRELYAQLDRSAQGTDAGYEIGVAFAGDGGPVVAYDPKVPPGYLVADVRPHMQYLLVRGVLAGGAAALSRVDSDVSSAFVYAQGFTRDGAAGCVTVSRAEDALLSERASFLQGLAPVLAACPLLLAVLAFVSWRLLAPLGVIGEAMEEFYRVGGGNQIPLAGMAHTELYDVGRTFNRLSRETRVQFNELQAMGGAYAQFVPDGVPALLGRGSVSQIEPGDCRAFDGALLVLAPRRRPADTQALADFLAAAAGAVHACGGLLSDLDEGLGAVSAVFETPARAREAAERAQADFGARGMDAAAAVLAARVQFGAFGAPGLLLTYAVAEGAHSLIAALPRLMAFGARLVLWGAPGEGGATRLLGWCGGAVYEDTALRPPPWRAEWSRAGALWGAAMERFEAMDFNGAASLLARFLRRFPGDGAAAWYLLRCTALRDTAAPPRAALELLAGEEEEA